jgi:hypothetical protein
MPPGVTEMAFELPPLIKQHPVATVAIVIVGGIGLFLIVTSGSNAGTSSAVASSNPGGLDDSSYAALLSAEGQQASAQSAANAQASQNAFTLAYGQQQTAAGLALQQEQDATAITESNTAAVVANNANTDQTTVQQQALSDTLAGLINNNDTSLGIAKISADENEGIAATNASVSTTIANDQETLGVTQANDYMQLGIAQASDVASVQRAQANAGALGGLFGAIGSLF